MRESSTEQRIEDAALFLSGDRREQMMKLKVHLK
jgi:hypothetical protein